MEPTLETLSMYGLASEGRALEWAWALDALTSSETYWVVPSGDGTPHPRPVWGVWRDGSLHLSIGSPEIRARLLQQPEVSVHLPDGLDVVIVEGRSSGPLEDHDAVALYDAKYDWEYDVEAYGHLTRIEADKVLAWRAVGPAGRDGFQWTGRWRFGG